MFHREERERGPASYTDLAIDVLDMVLRRSARDDELLGDLGIRETGGDEPEDVDLACAEAGGTEVVWAGSRLAGRLEHCCDTLTVELPARAS